VFEGVDAFKLEYVSDREVVAEFDK